MCTVFRPRAGEAELLVVGIFVLMCICVLCRFRPKASEAELLVVGRIFVLVLVGVAIVWIPIIQVITGEDSGRWPHSPPPESRKELGRTQPLHRHVDLRYKYKRNVINIYVP